VSLPIVYPKAPGIKERKVVNECPHFRNMEKRKVFKLIKINKLAGLQSSFNELPGGLKIYEKT
jgi:hypothetical protein